MACNFISQLSKLRKQSAESVENTAAFDSFKEYLHVERQVEIELRSLLREINEKQEKCLVLLCGSAGDGKSHLISYLKNSDPEHLLADFEPYNDATESSEPTLTSIDTLAIKLAAFNDENYLVQDGKKMIIAINLGTLNNFIDSEKGKAFSHLKEYVEKNGIFSDYSKSSEYQDDSVFQHISFSDYQVFSLNETGTQTMFLEELFKKIFQESVDNPFYTAYLQNNNCPKQNRCPVRHNYEFMMDDTHQKAVIKRIVEAVLMNKSIVSTRDVLNLVYDLLVHPDFNENKIGIGTSDTQFLTNYISWTTPMLLNENEDISPLLNAIRSHDILKSRNAAGDENATRFHSLENIKHEFNQVTLNSPYNVLNALTDVSELGKKTELKKLIYKFSVRLEDMNGRIPNSKQQNRLDEYIKYLYFQNSGNERKLGELYTATKRAGLFWNGRFDDDYICIDDTNEEFWVLEQLTLKSMINKSSTQIHGDIQRFSPLLKLRFAKDQDQSGKSVEVRVDFALFELIADMRDGYRPTIQDKNIHADFVSFVQQLIEFGNKKTRVTIVPKDSGSGYRAVIEETDFGFSFKVV